MPPQSTLTPEQWFVTRTFDESVRIIKPPRKGEGHKNPSYIPAFGLCTNTLYNLMGFQVT